MTVSDESDCVMTVPKRPIEYHPPADERLEALVQQASERLAERYADDSYRHPDVVFGFSAFLKLLAKLKAQQLNMTRDHFDIN
ncbi:MAG: hypothetical protein AAF787_12505 [Chloroflexota bacterium]